MGEIELPLWNADESDVLPQFRLSYGHVISDQDITVPLIDRLVKCHHFYRVRHSGELDYSKLPIEHAAGCRTLGNQQETHLLVVRSGTYCVIFAPHSSFFNNGPWIDWNKRVGGLMAIAVRHNFSETSFRIFRRGQRELSMWASGDKLQCLEDPNIEVHLAGDLLYRSSASRRGAASDVISMLRSDVEIIDSGKGILIKSRFSDSVIPDHQITHFSSV